MTTTARLLWILLWFVSNIVSTEGKVLKSVEHQQISDSEVLVSWQLLPGQARSWNYKMTYTYRLVQIGDCQPLLQSEETSIETGPWQTTLTLSGLESWRGYRYKLKASAQFSTEEDLLTGLFVTKPTQVPRKSVQSVQVQNISWTSADLSWREPPCVVRNGPLRRFDVQLSGPNSPLILNAYTGLYVTLSNLQPSRTYVVRVRYVNSVGPSEFTSPINFTTLVPTEDGAISGGRSLLRQSGLTSQRQTQVPTEDGAISGGRSLIRQSGLSSQHQTQVPTEDGAISGGRSLMRQSSLVSQRQTQVPTEDGAISGGRSLLRQSGLSSQRQAQGTDARMENRGQTAGSGNRDERFGDGLDEGLKQSSTGSSGPVWERASSGSARDGGRSLMKQGRTQPMQQAADTDKSSRTSRAVCGTTNNPCAPYNLKQVSETLTCVDISWKVNFVKVISAFDVYDCTDSDDVNHLVNLKTSPPSSSQTAKLCGLKPGHFYTFGVRSRTANNNVSNIIMIRVHTKHLAPPKPETPVLVTRSTTTIMIKFTTVSSTNGPVTSYYVIVETLQLTEEERVEAGIASGPKGYYKGRPVFPQTEETSLHDDSAMAQGEGQFDEQPTNHDSSLNQQHGSALGQNGRRSQLPPAVHQSNRLEPGSSPNGQSDRPGHGLTPTSQGDRWNDIPAANSQNERPRHELTPTSQNERWGQMPSGASQDRKWDPRPPDVSQSERWDPLPTGVGQSERWDPVPTGTSQNEIWDPLPTGVSQSKRWDPVPTGVSQNERWDPLSTDTSQSQRWGQIPQGSSQNGRFGQIPPADNQNGRLGQSFPENSQNARLGHRAPDPRRMDTRGQIPPGTNQDGRQGQFSFDNARETSEASSTNPDHSFVNGRVDGSLRASPGNRVKNSAAHFTGSVNNPFDSSGQGRPNNDAEEEPLQKAGDSNNVNPKTRTNLGPARSLEQKAEAVTDTERTGKKPNSKLTRLHSADSSSLSRPVSNLTSDKKTDSGRKSSTPVLIVRQRAKRPIYWVNEDWMKEMDKQAPEKKESQKNSSTKPNMKPLSDDGRQTSSRNDQYQTGTGQQPFLQPSLTIQKVKPQQHTQSVTPPKLTERKVKYSLPAKDQENSAVRITTKDKSRNNWKESDNTAGTEEASDPKVTYRLSLTLSGDNETANISSVKTPHIVSSEKGPDSSASENTLKKTVSVNVKGSDTETRRRTVSQKRKPAAQHTDLDKDTPFTKDSESLQFPDSSRRKTKESLDTSADDAGPVLVDTDTYRSEGRRDKAQQINMTASTEMTPTLNRSMTHTSQIISMEDGTPSMDETKSARIKTKTAPQSRETEKGRKLGKETAINDVIDKSETPSEPSESETQKIVTAKTRAGDVTTVTATTSTTTQATHAATKINNVQNIHQSGSLPSKATGTERNAATGAEDSRREAEEKHETLTDKATNKLHTAQSEKSPAGRSGTDETSGIVAKRKEDESDYGFFDNHISKKDRVSQRQDLPHYQFKEKKKSSKATRINLYATKKSAVRYSGTGKNEQSSDTASQKSGNSSIAPENRDTRRLVTPNVRQGNPGISRDVPGKATNQKPGTSGDVPEKPINQKHGASDIPPENLDLHASGITETPSRGMAQKIPTSIESITDATTILTPEANAVRTNPTPDSQSRTEKASEASTVIHISENNDVHTRHTASLAPQPSHIQRKINQTDADTVPAHLTEEQNRYKTSAIRLQDKHIPFPERSNSEVEKSPRRKRQVSKDDALPSGRIVAELKNVAEGDTTFTIGDGRTYGGYSNKPLDPASRYNIHIVANSKVETTLFSVSKPLKVSMPMDPTVTRHKANGRRDNFIVIGVMCTLALLLLLLMVWLKYLQYGDRTGPATSCCSCQVPDQFFMLDEDYSRSLFPGWWGFPRAPPPRGLGDLQRLTPERHWTETFSLSEPRSIRTGRELLPPSKMPLPNPNPDRPVGSEPVTFHKEFQALPRPNPANSTLGGRRHQELNNTPSVLPFDATRVLLDHDGTVAGDYINASFITGYMDDSGNCSTYIAAQCPFDEATALNMWRMIFQQWVGTVVILNKTIEDGTLYCLQFWPEMGKQETGPFVIQAMDQFTYAHFTEIHVSVRQKKYRNEELLVRLFCFTSWPENGVPQDAIPLVELCTRAHKSQGTSDRPLLVQCDTGSGRTAVFIAIDILLAQYAAEHQASVYDVVNAMRSERPFMVQTFPQYVLVYESVLEEMHAGDTWVSDDLRERYKDLNAHNPNTGRTYLRDQFILLEIMLGGNKAVAEGGVLNTQARPGIPLGQNAPDVIPGRRLPPYMPPPHPRNVNYNSNVDNWPQEAGYDDDDDSMVGLDNVIFVDGYRRKCQFIMAKTPYPATIADFWRHVYENDVRTIVMMQDPDPYQAVAQGLTRGEYWPSLGSHTWDPYLVELMDTECDHNLTIRTFRLLHRHRTRDEGKMVKQFHFHGWNPQDVAPQTTTPKTAAPRGGGYGVRGQWSRGPQQQQQQQQQQQFQPINEERRRTSQGCPPPSARSTLLSIHSMAKQWQADTTVDSTPVLVHCKNGTQCSGLYVAMSLMLARMDEENLVSIYRICRALRKQCPRAIGNFEQYKYLHKILWDYINLPPSEDGPDDRGWPPLDSPEAELRGGRWRGVMEEGWRDSPATDNRRVWYQGGDVCRTPKSGAPEKDHHICETVELTETEEEQTEGSTTRASDYYSMTTPQPSARRNTTPPPYCSSTVVDAYRFSPQPALYPRRNDRPPRQERGKYNSPRKTPTPTPCGDHQWNGGREAFTPRSGASPRTSTCNRPRSSLAQAYPSPSPVARHRALSLSPIYTGAHQDPSPRRRRRERAAERMSMEVGRRSSTSSVDGWAEEGRGRWGSGAAGKVKSETMVQETTEVRDPDGGVMYRQEVTDTVHEVSTSTRSESES